MGIFNRIKRCKLLICLLLVLATIAVYWQVQQNDFINYDDELYVTHNPHVKGGMTWKNIIWAFSAGYATNWHPITWLSHMLDVELYGLNSRGHHWTNVQIHIANTILLFLIFCQMTGALWRSAAVAALFALHPLHVESVAWIAERKDVLSTFFWMLSMWAYVRYVSCSRASGYFLLIMFYVLGLMSKPMLVTLPFVLILLDVWPLARLTSTAHRHQAEGRQNLKKLIWEKVPLFALSAVSSIITYSVQYSGGAVVSLDAIPFKIRIVNACISYLRYLGKMIWPQKLAVFYPYQQWPVGYALISGLLLMFISVMAVRTASRYPYLLTGWFWYLGTLFPVIGLVHAGAQSIADRYTYMPLVGIFIMIVWGISDFSKRLPHRTTIIAFLSAAVMVAYMIATWFQVRHWQNTITLFTHTLNVTHNNPVALFSLGYGFQKQGKFDEAAVYYMKTLEISPEYKNAHNNIGLILAREGKNKAAIEHYYAELMLYPENADTHNNLANALFDLGRLPEAAIHYHKALKVDPEDANAHYNLGNLLLRQEKLHEAIEHLAIAIKIKPDFAAAYNQIGVILSRQGKIEKARVFFSKAIQINPAYGRALNNLEVLRQSDKSRGKYEKKIRNHSE